MKIHFLGTCAGTEPMLDRQHTAFAIEIDGRLYWFDAGEGCSRTAHLKGLDLLSVCKIVISHPHMDHVGGLGNLLWTIRKLTTFGEKRPTKFDEIGLYIPQPETWEGVQLILRNSEGGFASQFRVVPHEVKDGLLFDDGVMRVTAFHNNHLRHAEGDPWRSFSYRIECEGQTLVYSGDIKRYTDLDEAIGEGCDAVIVETGHFGIDDVHAYMSGKAVGHVYFNHNGREVLSGRVAAREKLARLFGDRATLCEDGMTAVLGDGEAETEGERHQKALNSMMSELGFERVTVRGLVNFRMGDRFVRLLCGERTVALELAHGFSDATNNLYEDVELYEYEYVAREGLSLCEAVRADVMQYVVKERRDGMRIGVIGDMHMGENPEGIQSVFLSRAVEQMKKDGVACVLNLGDITAFGELSAFEQYLQTVSSLEHYFVLGNSDIRDDNTCEAMMARRQHPHFVAEGRTFVGLNTPARELEAGEKETLLTLGDGDVVFLHQNIEALSESSRTFMQKLLETHALTVIHGHSHLQKEYTVGRSRVISARGIDPDKAIGDFPTVTYLDISPEDIAVTQRTLPVSAEVARHLRSFMGISCVDNTRDVTYAAENGVKFIELRFNTAKLEPEEELSRLVSAWREKTHGYLSVHMPAVGYRDGKLQGEERFFDALALAMRLGADGLTVHVPGVRLGDMAPHGAAWEALLGCYTELARRVGDSVAIGIENLHMKNGEGDNEDRDFGYAPDEVASWIDAINEALGRPDRVGHVLDVGHARNNGILASYYPVGRWYERMGRRTVAYHIHQTVREDGKLKNHCPLVDWFGPMISYVSFLHAWETGSLNHVPVFLEVRGCEHFEASVKAFEQTFLS